MAFKVIVSPRAQAEIEEAVDYYAQFSNRAPAQFLHRLEEAYATLSINPYHASRYKNIRAVQLRKFPHCLYYTVNIELSLVKVLACFHSKRSPRSRP